MPLTDDAWTPDTLPDLDSLVLWSMRAWAIGLSRNLAVTAEIQALYQELQAPLVPACLDGFMWAVNNGAHRMLEVNCVCHPQVSEDERDLLDVLVLQQEGRPADAVVTLQGLVDHAAALRGCRCAAELIGHLRDAGHVMPGSSAALRRRAFQAICPNAAPSYCLH